MTPMRLELAASWSRVKHFTTEPLCSHLRSCDASKGSLQSNEPALVVEHALPLTGFVARRLVLQKFVFNWPNDF